MSYRRNDARGYAGRLYDDLKHAFGNRVFIDESISPGEDFARTIEISLHGCNLLLAVVGPDWTEHAARLNDPEDFVRLEIATALRRGIPVIPVLVGGAAVPAATCLPDDLKPLARRQALEIRDSDWGGGCRSLIAAIKARAGEASSLQKRLWVGAAGLILVACILLAIRLLGGTHSPHTNEARRPPIQPRDKANTQADNAQTTNRAPRESPGVQPHAQHPGVSPDASASDKVRPVSMSLSALVGRWRYTETHDSTQNTGILYLRGDSKFQVVDSAGIGIMEGVWELESATQRLKIYDPDPYAVARQIGFRGELMPSADDLRELSGTVFWPPGTPWRWRLTRE